MSSEKGLNAGAYKLQTADKPYEPYVRSTQLQAEFSVKAVSLGIVFGIVFGAANAYLGLVAGPTISTSIPIAVMTVAAFRVLQALGRKGDILEANISQTVGSASSSLASGIIFTLPALFLWQLDPELLQMVLLAICGGTIGVLFMIPLRKFLIDKEHGNLPYPEGTACAEVLVASDIGGDRSVNLFWGLGLGAVYKLLVNGLHLIPDKVTVAVPFVKKAELGCKVSAALFGVGYILGPRIGLVMVGGGLLSWLIIIPAIAYWGAGRIEPLYPETSLPIPDMSPALIWTRYVRYIGAGAVATGGLATLIRSVPTIVESIRIGVEKLQERFSVSPEAEPRTQQDLSLKIVGLLLLVLFLVMALIPQVFPVLGGPGARAIAGVLVILCAFFFVTVSSRIVGLVGVTSNPTSGMTIATLLLTSSVFLLLGWTGAMGKAAAISVGCVVAIAASIAGDTSQDLKTGFLLGATPRKQQIGELIGVLTSAAFVCLTVIFLHRAYGFGTEELPAPQATLMKVVIEGVLEQNLPWLFVGIGVGIALICELVRIPSLPFAVGVYLPVSTMVPVFLGGLLRFFAEKKSSNEEQTSLRREKGVLLGSGLVGGEGLLGVGIAGVAVILKRAPKGIGYDWAGWLAPVFSALAIALLAWTFWRLIKKA
ncbi:MAG: OPT family oligopeptide transporter [Planctomycetota bacterium]|jgi:putative OPT family oligopeptide transporter